MNQQTLFDLDQYDRPVAAQAVTEKSRSRRPKPRTEKPDICRIEFEIAKNFRLGQTVKLQRGKMTGVIIAKNLEKKILSTIWVCWFSGPASEFSRIHPLPAPELPSSLEIIAPAPVPKLPRDIVIDDSLVQKSPEISNSELLVTKNRTRESKIEKYFPCGKARGHNAYYRLYWWDTERRKNCYRHIRGGNVNSPAARERMEKVRDAIARGLPIGEILELC